MNKITPFFIVGSGRSGTTLLRRLLDCHSLVCVPDETHFIPKLYFSFMQRYRRGNLHQAVELLNNHPIIQDWGVKINAVEIHGLNGEQAYACAVDLLMRRKAEMHGKPYWGEKTPKYILEIPLLRKLFPDARFIHIYRDGRDVAISVMPLQWGPNNAYACARWWVQAIQAWQAVQPSLQGKEMEICYEDFVKDPTRILQGACEFLGLPYEPNLADCYPIRTDRIGMWKNKFYMSAKERHIFEAVAGETLQALNYELDGENPGLSLGSAVLSILDDGYKRISNRVLRT